MAESTMETGLGGALRQAVADLFAVESLVLDPHQEGLIRLYGRLLKEPEEAYQIVQRRFYTLGYTPLFREEDGRQVVVAVPGRIPKQETRLKLATILFAATVVSTLFVGIYAEWGTDRPLGQKILSGSLFALTLLAILVAHEMGHYLVARRLGVPVSLPFFIPMPLSFLGTMGAVIQMKAPPQNRRHLLAVGIAGPLAGLVVALPLLVVGLLLSDVRSLPVGEGYLLEGNSILYALLKFIVYGRFLPSGGEDVMLHSMAFAGWAGLLLTGLNLIPAGQLDGGHVAYALLGRWTRSLNWIIIAALAALGFIWSGWFLWAALIFLLGRRTAVPLDDLTRLTPKQAAVAVLVLLLFALTFVPIPLQVIAP